MAPALDSIELHVFQPASAAAAAAASRSPATRSTAAQRLVASLCAPPRTSHSASAWPLHPPEQPDPHTTSYTALLPFSLRPARLCSRPHRSPSPAPSPPEPLPSFTHHRPAPLPPASQPAQPTQSILKRRKSTGVAGAWVDETAAAARGDKRKKVVRVESPRSSAAAAVAAAGKGAGTSPLAKGKGKEKEVVLSEGGGERPDLARGAVQRCIPYPYCHLPRAPRSIDNLNPTRQHPARVLHSFVDPSYIPPTAPLSRSTSAASLGTASAAATAPQTQSTSTQLPLDSPTTMSYLSPGRRGAWLVPLSPSSLPLPQHARVAQPRWFAAAPPPPPAPRATEADAAPAIEWTDARLEALWRVLTSLHESGQFGLVRAAAYFPPPATDEQEEGEEEGWGEYVAVRCDAHLALAIREVLGQVSVSALSAGRKGKEERGRGEGDEEKFLKGRGLVWVDEEGEAVLVA